MFVVKNDPRYNAFEVIAGEMLNREHALNHFVNGEPRTEMPEGYVGYPSYTTSTRKYVLKETAAFIYIPEIVNLDWFVTTITKVIDGKQMSRLDGLPLSTKCAHRLGDNYCTTVIKETKYQRRFTIEDGKIHEKDDKTGTVRFLWQVRHIPTICTDVLGTQPELTIQRLAGIFWDADDITVHPHGTLTFEFSEESFKYSSRVTHDITLCNNSSNPLMFELSEYWSGAVSSTEAKEFMRNINLNKLVGATFDQVEVKPVKVDDESTAVSTDICFRCKEPLYGEIYGLSGYVSKQDEPIVSNGKIIITPICPLCMHTTPEDSPIEQKYVRTLRLTWNKSPHQMLESKGFPYEKDDICREALKQIVPYSVKIGNDISCKFYLIGDKYVGFTHSKDYKYTKLVNAQFLANRKFCKVMMVA